MSTAEELFADPDIARFLKGHDSCRDKLRVAANYLEKNPDAPRALRKIMSALDSNTINLYLSAAMKDFEFVKFLANTLSAHSAEKIRINYLGQSELSGSKWRYETLDQITHANWFILLILEPSSERDWHLFGAGQFAVQMTSADRMICLHHPDVSMRIPLEVYHDFSLSPPEIEKFLEIVFLEKNPIPGMPAINPHLSKRAIAKIAHEIVDAAPPPTKEPKTTFFSDQVFLRIHNRRDINENELPMNTIIEATPFSTKLFNLQDSTSDWKTFRSAALEQGNREWVEQVSNAVYKLNYGKRASPIEVLYKSGQSLYQTILIESRMIDANKIEVDILFVEKETGDAIRTDKHSIFGDAKKLSDPPDLFMLMPFDEKLAPVFYDHVKSLATEFQFNARRADDFFSLNSIVSDIWSAIYQAEIIIGDCTGRNPNVFYEIGIAHTLNKSTILISQSIDDVPFDLRHLRCLIYEFTPRGMREFEAKLRNMLTAILSQKKGS